MLCIRLRIFLCVKRGTLGSEHNRINAVEKFKLSVVKNCTNSTSHPPNQSLTFNDEPVFRVLTF